MRSIYKVMFLVTVAAAQASMPPSIPRPDPGSNITDPVFGTKIFRISGPSDGAVCTTNTNWIPFNADATRLLMFCMDDLTGKNRRNYMVELLEDGRPGNRREIPVNIIAGVEWDRSDPRVLYHASGTRLMVYHAGKEVSFVLKEFSAETNASYLGRLTMSDDNSIFAFMKLDQQWNDIGVLVWDRRTDRILLDVDSPGSKPSLDSSGRWVAFMRSKPGGHDDCLGDTSTGRYQCWDHDAFDNAYRFHGHGDLGHGFLAHWEPWQSMLVRNPLPEVWNWTTLFSFGYFGFELHASVGGPEDSILLVGTSYSCPWKGGSWPDYGNEIFAVNTNSPYTVWRLAHSRANPCHGSDQAYWQTTRPSFSQDGRFAVFTSNWYPEPNWETVADVYLMVLDGRLVTAECGATLNSQGCVAPSPKPPKKEPRPKKAGR